VEFHIREKIDIHRDNISASLFATNPTWPGLGLKRGAQKMGEKQKDGNRNRRKERRVAGKKTRTNGK
jgi:hypothetical protein